MSDASLSCDCCNAPMNMLLKDGAAQFCCTKCDQRHWFYADGRHQYTVIGCLYPSNMKETDALYREFIDYRLKEATFYHSARRLAGLCTQSDADQQIEGMRARVEEKHKELDIAAVSRPKWWAFWKRAA